MQMDMSKPWEASDKEGIRVRVRIRPHFWDISPRRRAMCITPTMRKLAGMELWAETTRRAHIYYTLSGQCRDDLPSGDSSWYWDGNWVEVLEGYVPELPPVGNDLLEEE